MDNKDLENQTQASIMAKFIDFLVSRKLYLFFSVQHEKLHAAFFVPFVCNLGFSDFLGGFFYCFFCAEMIKCKRYTKLHYYKQFLYCLLINTCVLLVK